MIKLEDKINKISRISSSYKYLQSAFENKLWGDAPSGAVSLVSMIEFATEYDYILEEILKLSKDLSEEVS